MARAEARIYTRVWSDPDQDDFRHLTVGAQWLYWLLLSQPELSMCGVLTVAVERWARLAENLKPRTVAGWLAELHTGRFVVHDDATTEVWLRAFLRLDGVLRTPNYVVAMARAFDAVHSQSIREGIIQELHREFPQGFREGIAERFPKGFPKGLEERFPEGFLHGLTRARARADVHAHPPVTESPSHPVTESPVPSSSSNGSGRAPAPANEDDDDLARTDAEVALAKRKRERPDLPIHDEQAWVTEHMERQRNGRNEPVDESAEQRKPVLERPLCGGCEDGWMVDNDGFAERCTCQGGTAEPNGRHLELLPTEQT